MVLVPFVTFPGTIQAIDYYPSEVYKEICNGHERQKLGTEGFIEFCGDASNQTGEESIRVIPHYFIGRC